MAISESLNISMTSPSGRKQSRAITNISPNATTTELNTFAQDLVGLTTNTLVVTSKITKEELSYDYDITFTLTEDPNTGMMTKVDNTTYTVDKSKIPLTTASEPTDTRILMKAGNYNIFNNTKDKLTFSFYPTGVENICPTITIIPQEAGGEMTWNLYIFITPADQEFINDLVGFKLVIHIPSGTIGGDKTYSPADLTFNFV